MVSQDSRHKYSIQMTQKLQGLLWQPQKAHVISLLYILFVVVVGSPLRFKGRKHRPYHLGGGWQGHIVEKNVKQERLLWPSLENTISPQRGLMWRHISYRDIPLQDLIERWVWLTPLLHLRHGVVAPGLNSSLSSDRLGEITQSSGPQFPNLSNKNPALSKAPW